MANVLYDFLSGTTITPYVGAGVGVDFVDGVYESCRHDLRLSGHRGCRVAKKNRLLLSDT
jgi:Surface antigen